MRRLLGPALVLFVVAAGCGDDDSSLTVPTTQLPAATTSTVTTAAPATTATTEPGGGTPQPGTLEAMAALAVEDPLYGSGFRTVEWGDEDRTFLVSQDSVSGAGDDLDLLGLSRFDPPPATGGLTTDQVLVRAWVQFPSSDVPPSAIVVYSPGGEGYEAVIVVDDASVEAAMLETTDYAAAAPDGPALVIVDPTQFDADSRTFVAGVRVFDADAPGDPAYEGEIACDFSGPDLTCETLSDDGVLRPGDEGEAVEALQEDLAAAGYYSGAADGRYGPQTERAVSRFQRDYLLGVDGKAGPNTLEMLTAVVDGTTDLVVASKDGVGPVAFGTGSEGASAALFDIFGAADNETGWYEDGCDGHDWFKARWDGFSAVFTDRNGTRQFDGWEVNDLSDLPSNLLIAGGIHAGTKWSYLDNVLGADFYDDYLGKRWRIPDMGYGNGRFAGPVTSPPAGSAPIASFGTGTGGFESC